jgi:hypothetical protein
MSKLSDLMAAVDSAKEELDSAERARDEFLQPILVILGATGGGISHVSDYMGSLSVTREGSTRGCSWRDDYDFPTSIFEADDPIAAAKDFVEKKKQEEARKVRTAKVAELNRLQKELTQEQ